MTVTAATGPTNAMDAGRSRVVGAAAGLLPALLITLLFVVSGSAAPPSEVAVSLGLVAIIAMSAGWLAGPLTRQPRRLLVATIGYAIALIVTTGVLSIIQGTVDAVAEHGLDPLAVGAALVGRALVATAGIAYFLIPALMLGAAWSIAAHGLWRIVGRASSAPGIAADAARDESA